MGTHYIGRQARRTNRNVLAVNGLLVVLVLAAGVLWQRYLYNFFFGPFPIDHRTLLTVNSPDDLRGYYVTLSSDRVLRHVAKNIWTRRDGTKEVSSEFSVAGIQDETNQRERWLVVQVPPGSSGRQFTGPLVPMQQEVVSQIILPLEGKFAPIRGLCIRGYYLDATGFRGPGYLGLAVALPVLGFGLWKVLRVVGRAANPERHPLMLTLARYGPPDEVAASIDREADELSNAPLRGPLVTRSWLLRPSVFGLQVVPLDDVVWVYRKVTKHSTNGVPTRTTHAAVINRRDGRSLEIGGTESAAGEVLQRILGSAPWILAGFDNELAGLWASRRDVVLDIVDKRRQQFHEQARPNGEPGA